MKYDSKREIFYSPLFSDFSDRLFFVVQGRATDCSLDWDKRYSRAFSEGFVRSLAPKFPRLSQRALLSPVRPEFIDDNAAGKVGASLSGKRVMGVDGLYTNSPDLPLIAMGADCATVAFFDPKHNVAGLIHAGWRGIFHNICETIIGGMGHDFNSNPRDVYVAVGPMISACGSSCYEVDDDVSQFFEVKFPRAIVSKKANKTHLNLLTALVQTLEDAGILKEHIDAETFCTKCYGGTLLHSRRHSPLGTKSQIATIVLTP